MDNVNNNQAYKIAGSALIGGGIGAAIGAAKAPSILGKVNADKFIKDSVYHAAIVDSFEKAGKNVFQEAQRTIKSRETCISSSNDTVKKILPGDFTEMTTATFKEKINLKLKEINPQWAESVTKRVSEFSDDVYLEKSHIEEFITEANPQYAKTKEYLNNFVNSLPKKTGKYALIGGAVGATVFALIKAFRLGKNQKNN